MENANISHIQCCFERDPGKRLHLNEPGNLKTIKQNKKKINFKKLFIIIIYLQYRGEKETLRLSHFTAPL